MNSINGHIDTTQKYTAPPSMDSLPVRDQAPQVSLGLEMAQRAAHAAQQPPPPPPTPMRPIVAVAN